MTKFTQKAILLLSAALILSACGNDPNAANEANFEKALNAHYVNMKECFRVGSRPTDEGVIQEFPAPTNPEEVKYDKQYAFFNGLRELGLLEAVTYKKDRKNFSGEVTGSTDWVGFKFSANAETYLRPKEFDKGFFSTGARQLCYGTPQVVEITNFTEPAEVMGVKASTVQYTYKLVDVAAWANSPIIPTKFRSLPERLSNQAIKKDDDMVLTNNGWVHHSAFAE